MISFKFGVMEEIAKLYIVISVWMTVTFTQGLNCTRNGKKFRSFFSEISQLIWMKFSVLPQPAGLFKPMLNIYFGQVIFKGENFAHVI